MLSLVGVNVNTSPELVPSKLLLKVNFHTLPLPILVTIVVLSGTPLPVTV